MDQDFGKGSTGCFSSKPHGIPWGEEGRKIPFQADFFTRALSLGRTSWRWSQRASPHLSDWQSDVLHTELSGEGTVLGATEAWLLELKQQPPHRVLLGKAVPGLCSEGGETDRMSSWEDEQRMWSYCFFATVSWTQTGAHRHSTVESLLLPPQSDIPHGITFISQISVNNSIKR